MKTELLQQLAPELRAPIEREWERQEIEIRLLKEMLRLLRIDKYGRRSEQFSDRQLALLELEPGVAAAEIETEAGRSALENQDLEDPAAPRRRHPGRAELPAHLPRVERILTCPEGQCRCAACGAEKKIIGYDTSEELDLKPAEFFVLVTRREKRACPQCEEGGISAAPLAAKIVDKCKASNRLVVDVILKKYLYHLPLYRQSALFQREAGIDRSRMTLCGWVMQGGTWLEAISRAMRAELLGATYIQADETPVGVQTNERTGRNHRAYLWQYSRPGGPVVFDFRMGRSRDGPREFLGQFRGILQSDGYGAYDRIGGEGLIHAGCMAHVRRGFIEALKVAPGDAGARQIVSAIGKLYAIEKQARESRLCALERRSLRQQASVPLLGELKHTLISVREQTLAQSALGKACSYALGQWNRVSVFAEHGEVEIDNNWCENAMRPTVVGRKNWLHIGSEQAGPRIAAITSVIETCRRLAIPERDYLLEVLPKIPDWPAARIAELTPMAWAGQRAAS